LRDVASILFIFLDKIREAQKRSGALLKLQLVYTSFFITKVKKNTTEIKILFAFDVKKKERREKREMRSSGIGLSRKNGLSMK